VTATAVNAPDRGRARPLVSRNGVITPAVPRYRDGDLEAVGAHAGARWRGAIYDQHAGEA